MKYKNWLLSIAMVWTGALAAQEGTLSFSLQEAQDYALQHNKTLKNANQDVMIARAKVKEAAGSGLPQVNGAFDYMTNFGYEVEFNFGGSGQEVPPIQSPAFDAGDQVLAGILTEMLQPTPATIKMSDQASANMQVSQLIFSGQYWVGIQMAKVGRKLAETSFTLTELDVKENVTNTYYLVLITREMLRILEENENNLQEVLKLTNDMYKVGMSEQTDVDQIRITVSQLENSRNAMERNLQLNMNMFRFVMGIDGDQEIVFKDDLVSLTEEVDVQSDLQANFNLEQNPTYQAMSMQEDLMEKSLNLKRWSYAPTVAGYYSYRYKILTTSFDLSPKHAAGLTLSLPIFTGGTSRAQVSQAKIELDKASRNKSLLEEQLALQDKQLSFELKSAWENYSTQKENVVVAERVFTNVQNKYRQGMVSSLDLTLANNNYLTAESNYISAVLSLLQSKMKLDKLYNTL